MDYFRYFKAPSLFAQEYLLFSDGLGHLKDDDFKVDRQSFRNNLIMYVISGVLHVEQRGHHILKTGEGIVMRLSEAHKYYSDEKDVCEILWMHFGGKQCDPILVFLQNSASMPMVFRVPEIEGIIRECFAACQKEEPEHEFIISQQIYATLLAVTKVVYCYEKDKEIDENGRFMKQVAEYVSRNITEPITLDALAKEFRLSKNYFSRLFKHCFGMPPIAYVLKQKVEFSKYMLTYTNQKISSIATDLGFADQSHFSKTFRHYQGQYPSEFRRMGL